MTVDWWSLFILLLQAVILSFGWMMRQSWEAMRKKWDKAIEKLDHVLDLQAATDREVVRVVGTIAAHDVLDNERFRVHERRFEQYDAWLQRIEKHMENTDREIARRHQDAER